MCKGKQTWTGNDYCRFCGISITNAFKDGIDLCIAAPRNGKDWGQHEFDHMSLTTTIENAPGSSREHS